MKLSVVVPALNSASTLPTQLEALTQQSLPPWEVIVADNGSQDATREVARAFAERLPRLKVVDASRRRGAAAARNTGAAAASGDCIAFCDADDEVDVHWVEGLVGALSTHDFVASRFDFQRLNPTKPIYVHEQESGLQTRQFRYRPHAGGCGLAVRRAVHEAVGGFDETMRYHEDTDYCWRIQQSGHPLGFAGGAVVHIRSRVSGLQAFRQARTWAASEVQLYKRYRQSGLRVPDRRSALRDWVRMPRRLMQAMVGRRSWYGFWWQLGIRVGHLHGSLMFLILIL